LGTSRTHAKQTARSVANAVLMMRMVRTLPQFANALAVIAPESNFGNYAADIQTELLLQGFGHFVIANMTSGGQDAGLYTSNSNKKTYASALRNLIKLGSVCVWSEFIAVTDAGVTRGNLDEWLGIVREYDKFWRYVFPSRTDNRPPRIELTAKRNPNGRDDAVITAILAVRMLSYWSIDPRYFTSRSNPFNHSDCATAELSEVERITIYQQMNLRDTYG